MVPPSGNRLKGSPRSIEGGQRSHTTCGNKHSSSASSTQATAVLSTQTGSSLSSLETADIDMIDHGPFLDTKVFSSVSHSNSTVDPFMPTLMESFNNSGSLKTSVTGGYNVRAGGTLQISPSTGVVVTSNVGSNNTNTVPEFLYQLTKMLTDDNRDIIEWSNAKIEVHSPHKLETHVLNRYFRHSKFASFQRQLNYFGFRKLAGKGKMAPCSYVNDTTTNELGSLLLIKRKQGPNEAKSKTAGKKRDRSGKLAKSHNADRNDVRVDNTVSSNIDGHMISGALLHRQPTGGSIIMSTIKNSSARLHPTQKAIALVAVGKGVRHGYVPQLYQNETLKSTDLLLQGGSLHQVAQPIAPSPAQALDALAQNYNESLQVTKDASLAIPSLAVANTAAPTKDDTSYVPGSLRRDDSLLNLAMIPGIVDDIQPRNNNSDNVRTSGFSFVDFPFDSNFFSH